MGDLDAVTVDYSEVCDDRHAGWVPMRITARMASPVVYFDDGLCLDGPLSWAMYAGLASEVRDQMPPPDKEPWLPDFDLPLAKWTHQPSMDYEHDERLTTASGDLWGWCISHVVADWRVAGQMGVRKMTVDQEVKRWSGRAKINTASGRFKPDDKTYPTRRADILRWYALGDPEDVRRLLTHVTHLGKNRAGGCGALRMDSKGRPDWTIETIDEDRSMTNDGQLMRRMPFGWSDMERPARPMAVRAPSWHRSRYHLMMEADIA